MYSCGIERKRSSNPRTLAMDLCRLRWQRTEEAKHLIPEMKLQLYHWQLHSMIVAIHMNSGTDSLKSALLGDEMGLGKV